MASLTGSRTPSRPAAAVRTATLRLLNAAFGLVASVAISRALQPQGRGVYAIAATVAAVASVLGGMALPRALQFSWGRGHTTAELSGAVVVAGLTAGAGAAFVVGAVAVLLPPLVPTGAAIVWLAVAGVPTLVASTHLTVLLSLHGRPDRAAAAALAAGLVQSALLIAGAVAGLLTPLRVIAVTTVSLVLLLPAHLRALPPSARPARRPGRVRLVRTLLRHALPYQPAAVAGHLLLRADLLVLAALATATQVGHYSLSLALTETALLITASVAQAGSGTQIRRSDHEADRSTARLTRTTLAVAVVLACGIALSAGTLVPLLFGATFRPSVGPLLILLPGVCALAATPPLELAVSRRARPGVAAVASGGALVVMLALDVALIPRWGVRGAAVGAAAGYTVQFLVLARWFVRIAGIRPCALIPRPADLWRPVRSLLSPRPVS